MTVLDDRPVVPVPTSSRQWAFVDRVTGKARIATCMPGCESDHSGDMRTPTFPEDIWCEVLAADVHMPVNTSGYAEDFRVLGVKLSMIPFSRVPAERVPHAVVEVVDDHWMDGLDPDGLATVISTLEQRVQTLRSTHARLVAIRAQHGYGPTA
ncbi:DUF6907 domain-containing protein [Streptomyces katrae]|uniref:DUF6907 domain-containing protein n=1 Tax=Streptomyces katrae TaxID=68223 RepID=UPI0004C10627|nr:hypothetical protein [Streptomyces katrae]